MHHTRRPISVPRRVKHIERIEPTLIISKDTGFYVEPFIHIIQQSCDGNARCAFSGNELHVRATKDIDAGSEITIRHPLAYDFVQRAQLLRDYWKISCTCSLCLIGPIGPTGALRQRIMELITLDRKGKAARLPDIISAIQDMDAAGFTYAADLRFHLHFSALHGYLASKQAADALKACLTIRYLVEPNMKPPVSTDNRLATLFYLICLANPAMLDPDIDTIPLQVREVLCALRMHWRRIHLRYAEECFGKYHPDVGIERRAFLTCLMGRKYGMNEDLGYPFLAIDSQDDRLKLVVLLNAVLRWAGIPQMTEEQLLGPSATPDMKERPLADLSLDELELKSMALTKLAMDKMGLEGQGFDDHALEKLGLSKLGMEDIAIEMASKVMATDAILKDRAHETAMKEMALDDATLGDMALGDENVDDLGHDDIV
jgi:hypothetical protein